jgi:hypothetical protein
VVVHFYNPSTQEVASLGYIGRHSETLSHKNKRNKKTQKKRKTLLQTILCWQKKAASQIMKQSYPLILIKDPKSFFPLIICLE